MFHLPPKKDCWRSCGDYRRLNRYPLRPIQGIVPGLHEKKILPRKGFLSDFRSGRRYYEGGSHHAVWLIRAYGDDG